MMARKPVWGEVQHEFLELAPRGDECVLCGQPRNGSLHVKNEEAIEMINGPSGLPLQLSFTPDAIREHFESDEEIEPLLDAMSEDDLKSVGEKALMDDRLYETFHEILCDAVREGP